jgi:hypothetical protein
LLTCPPLAGNPTRSAIAEPQPSNMIAPARITAREVRQRLPVDCTLSVASATLALSLRWFTSALLYGLAPRSASPHAAAAFTLVRHTDERAKWFATFLRSTWR